MESCYSKQIRATPITSISKASKRTTSTAEYKLRLHTLGDSTLQVEERISNGVEGRV
jgi:hypothetical protein